MDETPYDTVKFEDLKQERQQEESTMPGSHDASEDARKERRSRSASPAIKREERRSHRSRSRSRSVSPRRRRDRSRSRSPRRRSHRRSVSRSRSRSRDRKNRKSRSRSRHRSPSPRRPRSRSWDRHKQRKEKDLHGTRDAPEKSNILGVFGLSLRTRERNLEEVFEKYGNLEKVTVVYDHRSNRSRGFGFITFGTVEEAERARDETNGLEIDERKIRVDFSMTHRPHTPTPGEYMGERRTNDRSRERRPRRMRRMRSRTPERRRRYRSRSRSRSWSR